MNVVREKTSTCCNYVWRSFSRTKSIDVNRLQETELRRCLNVMDLTALGVGSTLGAGIYVITGQVAKNQAGPAVVISFLIAAVASLLAGVCYAEFASRVPRAGSAYIYSYVSVGELWAFVIGWNMILENMIGAASVGKAWSEYFDSVINDTIKTAIIDNIGGFRSPGLAEYPDFLACSLLLVTTLLVSIGVKMSSVVSFIFTLINMVVITGIILIGVFYVDGRNWTDPPGFFPMGLRGVISGAATCFYSFVGFDTIATSGEEAKNPSKNIPKAIVSTLLVCFFAYFGVSAIMTLMVRWDKLADEAALPNAFAMRGVYGGEYIIVFGGMCGLTASMMGSIFPLPRTIYAMSKDGLLFRWMGEVNTWTNTPIIATWLAGFVAAILALLLPLDHLVQMMSIGTLMAYTLVAASVLVLRYQRDHVGLTAADIHQDMDEIPRNISELSENTIRKIENEAQAREDTGLLRVGENVNVVQYAPSKETTMFKRVKSEDDQPTTGGNNSERQQPKETVEEVCNKKEKEILRRMANYMSTSDTSLHQQPPEGSTYQRIGSNYSLSSLSALFNFGHDSGVEPTEDSRKLAIFSICVIVVLWTSLCVLTIYGEDYIINAAWWAILLIVLFLLVIGVFIVILARQPRNQTRLGFHVPFVPLIPLMSILVNIYLMLTLSETTWIRFLVWMLIGFLIYFGYGMHHSSEHRGEDQEVILYDIGDGDSIYGQR